MASVPTNPTIGLQAALAEFQSALSDGDRKRLQAIKNKPEIDAAIQFTATLDQENAAKRKGHSISSRLYSVLLSVQQFSTVVDTFVSANPTIAALIWRSVKLTMLIVTNSLNYYEETSKAFLDFGRWSPRLSQYQSLFPTSMRLQAAIWKAHLVNSLTKSFQSELENHISIMKSMAREVSSEIELAKAQSDVEEQKLQRQERSMALSHRSAMTSFISKYNDEISDAQRQRAVIDRRNKVDDYQKLLDNISTFDYVTALNQARSKRYHSTGGWVFKSPVWRDWKNEDGSIGSGKTVLSATITDHLLASRQASESISFFFPRFDYADSLMADTVIRSLIRQNLQPDLVDKLSYDITKAYNSFYSQDTMLDLLVSKTAIFSTNYLLIDSLDECEPKDLQKILQILAATINRSSSKVKVLIVSRDALHYEITHIFPQAKRLRMNAPEAASDLELFAYQTLSERMNMGQLTIGNLVSLETVYKMIVSGAQGMFIWVALEIDDVCSQVCEEDVLLALQNIPTTFTDILSRALLRILNQGNPRIAKEVFKWISVAKRPLLLDELQDALSIKPGSSYSMAERRPQRMEKLPLWCANLVEIDEISSSVQFIHHTVRTFILDTSIVDAQMPKLNEFHSDVNNLDLAVGELCVTYLAWNDFKRALESSKPQQDRTIDLPEPRKIMQTALGVEWKNKSIAIMGHLMPQPTRREKCFTFDLGCVTPSGASSILSYPFLEYAKDYWILHTRLITAVSSIHWLWRQMIRGSHHVAKTEWTESEYRRASESILIWAQTHCHLAILNELISEGGIYIDRFHGSMCNIVAENPSLLMVQLSLKSIERYAPSYWTSDMVLQMEVELMVRHILAHGDPLSKIDDYANSKKYHPGMLSSHFQPALDATADVTHVLELTYFASVRLGLADLMTTMLVRNPHFCDIPDCIAKGCLDPFDVALRTGNRTAQKLLGQRRGADGNREEGIGFAESPPWFLPFGEIRVTTEILVTSEEKSYNDDPPPLGGIRITKGVSITTQER
ncbi:hypothetical protein F4802DRAFT_613498 [Xylaria palmicola]|nr:hypothetical protein F4802DRAFT_613498 [Xylaria palmicola]